MISCRGKGICYMLRIKGMEKSYSGWWMEKRWCNFNICDVALSIFMMF
ncbi:hypothetical protein Hanom_Chr00s142879g01819481 [Helianthus anomalus]